MNRSELEALGPPTPEEVSETNIPQAYLCDLTLKHVAMLPEPSTDSVSERMRLPRALTEELLYHLYREKLIEMRLQSAVGATRYAMLDHGWGNALLGFKRNQATSGPRRYRSPIILT